MIDRFTGPRGKQLLIQELASHRIMGGNRELVAEVVERGEMVQYGPDHVLIEQGAFTNDVFLLVAGVCDVIVNGRVVAKRGPGDHVGEMAAIQPTQPRSATVMAKEPVVALKLSEETFADLGGRHPLIYLSIAQELSRRLLQRNKTIGAFRQKVKIFIISSVEALPIARAIENAFEYDPFSVEIWNEGCFKVANYTLQDLEDAVDNSDFAIAIAHADDLTTSRENEWPAPRDNVIFELGLFMGRLGRQRAILMEPRDQDVKLPSDLAGITTIPYRFEKGAVATNLMGAACNRLRDHINALGPDNG